jgi:3-oxoacyl-[acyl-carrier protein] reductase
MQGNSYVVIGGGGGVGSAVARMLREAGANVLIAGRDEAKLQAVGGSYQVTDASHPEQVEAAVEKAKQEFGKLDGIANCAGSLLLKPGHLTSLDEWNQTITANLTSAYSTLRAGVKGFGSQPGSVVLVSSAAGRLGLANHEAIAAAKAGVIGLTISAAASYGSRGIRVNCVAPGLVETPLTSRITSNEAAMKASMSMHALGKAGKPEDVASAIVWLLNPAQSWVTGQVIGVDGGLGTVRAK